MKFLIWFFVCTCYGFVTTYLKKIGITLGFLPTVILAYALFSLADFLCDKWDVKSFEKTATKKGMTPGAYASTVFPPSFLELCATNKDDKREFERILKQNIKAEVITKADANVLRYMFLRK